MGLPTTAPVIDRKRAEDSTPATPAKTFPQKARKKRGRPRGVLLSARDRAMLTFLSKVTMAKAEHLAMVVEGIETGFPPAADPVKSVAARLYKLERSGLVAHSAAIQNHTTWFLTGKGWHEMGRPGLRTTRVSLVRYAHTLGLAYLTAKFEGLGAVVVSDLELETASKARLANGEAVVLDADFYADPSYGAPELADSYTEYFIQQGRGPGGHRPDAIVLKELENGERLIRAVELEISPKTPVELEANLAIYINSLREGRFTEVVYYCTPPVKRHISRIIKKEWGESANEAFRGFQFVDWNASAAFSDIPVR